ncbi:hypothetical protein LEP1GSC202_0288 [Leptospira yanagawae serovar Saopaulo str. Sao Paulo = ATCC 700523]|uniref:Uncharacterized protein n=1 Tax=Leptospira yanagawae serovar Saopaulo str. Sao Paulo = ATCC 700523 TaxID=1249483 RepID=A0A5E8HA50_9LEPT|nr:hypothetical protein LEP1GSC202_0288 [Leptospira yanagawae serovar Saopaulo str. Sao Paulo = ATCC 700523]
MAWVVPSPSPKKGSNNIPFFLLEQSTKKRGSTKRMIHRFIFFSYLYRGLNDKD